MKLFIITGFAIYFLSGIANAEGQALSEIPAWMTDSLARWPCRLDDKKQTQCDPTKLDGKSLRELSMMRNEIFARHGWNGFRKEWLKKYFKAQPWFKPSKSFSYKLLSPFELQNVHTVAVKEQMIGHEELLDRRDAIFARYGKTWNDRFVAEFADGGTHETCSLDEPNAEYSLKGNHPEDDVRFGHGPNSLDCNLVVGKGYRPDPNFSEDKVSDPNDKIELGLISRALGQFSIDEEKRAAAAENLDSILDLTKLRQLSVRDLRFLRNTIFARRGRVFKSPTLQKHFENMGWYHQNPLYTDELLTDNDKRNVKLIGSVEREFGGALNEEEFTKDLIEPSIDQG